jgi:hypothetical protein
VTNSEYPALELAARATWTPAQLDKFWSTVDANGNGMYVLDFPIYSTDFSVSLNEIDRAVLQVYPRLHALKRVMMRAYKTADVSGDGLVQRTELNNLLTFIVVYEKLWNLFAHVDTNGDKRLSRDEFMQGAAALGFDPRDKTAMDRMFSECDANGGGLILFDEFCNYMACKLSGATLPKRRESKQVKATTKRVLPGIRHASQQPTGERGMTPATSPVLGRAYADDVPTLERRLHAEQLNRHRLEATIHDLRNQIVSMGGKVDEKAMRYTGEIEMLVGINRRLGEKVEVEKMRYSKLEDEYRAAVDRVHQLESEGNKQLMEEVNRSRTNNSIALAKEVKDLRLEKAKFERLCDEMARKLTVEQEVRFDCVVLYLTMSQKSKRLAEELLLVRHSQKYNTPDRVRTKRINMGASPADVDQQQQ